MNEAFYDTNMHTAHPHTIQIPMTQTFYLVSVPASSMMIASLFALIYSICNFVKFIFILGLPLIDFPFSLWIGVCVCVPSKSIRCPYFPISFIYLFAFVGFAIFVGDFLAKMILLKQTNCRRTEHSHGMNISARSKIKPKRSKSTQIANEM